MSLFEQVIAESGLSRVFAASTIKRACQRAGIIAERMTTRELQDALPEIREALRMFLDPPQVEARMRKIQTLTQPAR